MINRLSERVVSWLRREGCVEASEVPLFRYAAYSFIWGLLPFIIVTVWGIIFNALLESTLLILPFMLIRKFSGGYHLSNPGICFATSTILLGFAVWGLTVINSTTSSTGLSVAVFLSVVIICVFSPIPIHQAHSYCHCESMSHICGCAIIRTAGSEKQSAITGGWLPPRRRPAIGLTILPSSHSPSVISGISTVKPSQAMGAVAREPREGEIPVEPTAIGRLMTSQ